MAYRKLSGDHLFDGKIFHDNAVLVLDDKDRKVDIISRDAAGDDVVHIPGLLTPGWVNAHCHLELSHLRNRIPTGTGLVDFLLEVVRIRGEENAIPKENPVNPDEAITRMNEYTSQQYAGDLEDFREQAMTQAIQEMEADGIIAVGDICNTGHSLPFKLSGGMQWCNFIEVVALTEQQASERIPGNQELLSTFKEKGLKAALSPHAPYTVHTAALQIINQQTEEQLITIHNQESPAENVLFEKGDGDFLRLYNQFGYHKSPIAATGHSSIRSFLPYFDRGQRIILVHNTSMSEADIVWANAYAHRTGLQLYYCLCPHANLYIEKTLPNIPAMIRHGCRILLGTDSLASNHQLRITDEMVLIHQHFPEIDTKMLLQWATANAIEAMKVEERWIVGSSLMQRIQHRQ